MWRPKTRPSAGPNAAPPATTRSSKCAGSRKWKISRPTCKQQPPALPTCKAADAANDRRPNMSKYVDGFVPVPKDKVEAYRKMAAEANAIWMEYGALAAVECVAD